MLIFKSALLALLPFLGLVSFSFASDDQQKLVRHYQLDPYDAIALSPSGKVIALSRDKNSKRKKSTVELIDRESGKILGSIKGSWENLSQLSFLPGSDLILFGIYPEGPNNTWRYEQGKILYADTKIYVLDFTSIKSPTVSRIFSGRDKKWSGLSKPAHNDAKLAAYALHPSGKILALGSRSYGASLWDISESGEGKLLSILKSTYGVIAQLVLSLDGHFLAATTEQRSLCIWDIKYPEAPKRIFESNRKMFETAGGIALNHNSKILAVSTSPPPPIPVGPTPYSIRLIRLNDSEHINWNDVIVTDESVGTLVFSQDDRWLAASIGNGIKIWDLLESANRNKPRYEFNQAEGNYSKPIGFTVSPNRLLISTRKGEIQEYELPNGN